MRGFSWIIGLWLVGWLLGACQGTVAPLEVKIGLVVPISGPNAALGRAAHEGAELAIKELNAAELTLEGQPLRFILLVNNDQGQPSAALAATEELVEQEGVVALVGPYLDRNVLAVADLVEAAQVPLISPTSTTPDSTAGRDYIFRATYTNAFQGEVLARFALDELSTLSHAAVLYNADEPYSRSIAESFKAHFEAGGGSLRAFIAYKADEQEFVDYMKEISQHGLEVLVLPNYPEELLLQLPEARGAGLFQTILTGDAIENVDAAANPVVERTFFTAPWHPDAPNPRNEAFVRAYQAEYDRIPTSVSALSYDTIGLIAAAIQQQGSVAPTAIRQGLSTMSDYEGVTGSFNYQNSGNPVKPINILQFHSQSTHFYKQVEPAPAGSPPGE